MSASIEVSSVAAQADWVAPNRRAGALGTQVDWVAPNRRTGAVGLVMDYWSPPLSGLNLLVNPEAEDGDTTGWLSSQSEGGDGPFEVRSVNPNPYIGGFYFTAGTTGGSSGTTKELSQEVDLLFAGFAPSTLDGSPLIGFGGWQASLSGDDMGRVEIEFLDGPSGAVIGSHSGGDLAPIGWTEQRHVVRVPLGTRAVRFVFTGTKVLGGDIDSYLDGAWVVLDAATTTAPPTTTTLPPITTFPPTTTTPYLGQHPADIGLNFRMSSTEVLAYAGDWLTGGTLEFQGTPLTGPGTAQAYILRAAAIMLANFQARYEDAGSAETVNSPAHAQRWQELPDL